MRTHIKITLLLAAVALSGCNDRDRSKTNFATNGNGNFSASVAATYSSSTTGGLVLTVSTTNGTFAEATYNVEVTPRGSTTATTVTFTTTVNPFTLKYFEKSQFLNGLNLDEVERITILDTSTVRATDGSVANLNREQVNVTRVPAFRGRVDYVPTGNPDQFRVRLTRVTDRASDVDGNIYVSVETLDASGNPLGTDLFRDQDMPLISGTPITSVLVVDTAIHSSVRFTFKDVQGSGGLYTSTTTQATKDANGNVTLPSGELDFFAD